MKQYFLLVLVLVLAGCVTTERYTDVVVRGKWFEAKNSTVYFVSFEDGTSDRVNRGLFSRARPGQKWCYVESVFVNGFEPGSVYHTETIPSICPVAK